MANENTVSVKINGISYTVINPANYEWSYDWYRAFGGWSDTNVYAWSLGAVGGTHLISIGSSYEEGIEEIAEWCAENAPGHLIDFSEMAELEKEAREELGPNAEQWEVDDLAQADLVYTEAGYMTSYEMAVHELFGEDADAVALACLEADEDISEDEYQSRKATLTNLMKNPPTGKSGLSLGKMVAVAAVGLAVFQIVKK